MPTEYTIRAVVIYELSIVADDADEAMERAIGVKFSDWREIDADFDVSDVEKIPETAPHDTAYD